MSERRPERAKGPTPKSKGPICRTCRREVEPDVETFPFCSKRCRMVDLGGWFDERFRVTRPIEYRDVEEG